MHTCATAQFTAVEVISRLFSAALYSRSRVKIFVICFNGVFSFKDLKTV